MASSQAQDLSLSLQSRTNDILMLKRLNFLKTSLDGHSPRQTTNNMRVRNLQKRDQRIIETWKNDMEKANVQELLQHYI